MRRGELPSKQPDRRCAELSSGEAPPSYVSRSTAIWRTEGPLHLPTTLSQSQGTRFTYKCSTSVRLPPALHPPRLQRGTALERSAPWIRGACRAIGADKRNRYRRCQQELNGLISAVPETTKVIDQSSSNKRLSLFRHSRIFSPFSHATAIREKNVLRNRFRL